MPGEENENDQDSDVYLKDGTAVNAGLVFLELLHLEALAQFNNDEYGKLYDVAKNDLPPSMLPNDLEDSVNQRDWDLIKQVILNSTKSTPEGFIVCDPFEEHERSTERLKEWEKTSPEIFGRGNIGSRHLWGLREQVLRHRDDEDHEQGWSR